MTWLSILKNIITLGVPIAAEAIRNRIARRQADKKPECPVKKQQGELNHLDHTLISDAIKRREEAARAQSHHDRIEREKTK